MNSDSAEKGNQLIGVQLITGGKTETQTCLGVVIVPCKDDMTLTSLRTVLYCQVTTLPEDFAFCTKQGWKINRNLESSVLVNQVLCEDGSLYIQRQFEKPYVGICDKSGQKLGFIFIDLHLNLTEVRRCINSQMTCSKLSRHNYWFLTHNGWPISSKQESQLAVIDILDNSCLTVDIQTFLSPSSSPLSPSPQPRKKIKGSRHLSFRTSKDLDRKQIADSSMTDEKQILISYVRVDAAHHALSLKQELSALGYSVYLDVHEISSGVDWQDSLNDAVRNCQVFVPLVTSRYGETLWTNREVKLADVLGKYIIPVSFLPEWPPPCLAIQFSTTQYISWRHPINSGEIKDICNWDPKDLKYVAQQIAEKVLTFIETNTDTPSLIRRKTIVRSCPFVDVSNPQATLENRDGHPLIVICVHPQQFKLGEEMKTWLEGENFEVWCSTQLAMDYSDSLMDLDCGIKPSTLEINNRQIFQEQADEAGVIVLVLSQQFVLSRTCQQQVFYCEHRKKLVPLVYGDFVIPGWLTVLTGRHLLMNAENYKVGLLTRLHKLLTLTHQDREAFLDTCLLDLRRATSKGLSVYVAGGTDVDNTEKICRSIGTQLASVDHLIMGTGGGYGVEDIVAQSFYQETQRLWKTSQVIHIFPQQETGNKHYGQNMCIGDSVDECIEVVAQIFDVLVVIRGVSEQTKLIENFIWNEKTVIPVLCDNEECSALIQKPLDIQDNILLVLTDSQATPEKIGKTVKDIIIEKLQDVDVISEKQEHESTISPNTALRKMTTVLLPNKV